MFDVFGCMKRKKQDNSRYISFPNVQTSFFPCQSPPTPPHPPKKDTRIIVYCIMWCEKAAFLHRNLFQCSSLQLQIEVFWLRKEPQQHVSELCQRCFITIISDRRMFSTSLFHVLCTIPLSELNAQSYNRNTFTLLILLRLECPHSWTPLCRCGSEAAGTAPLELWLREAVGEQRFGSNDAGTASSPGSLFRMTCWHQTAEFLWGISESTECSQIHFQTWCSQGRNKLKLREKSPFPSTGCYTSVKAHTFSFSSQICVLCKVIMLPEPKW